MTMRQPSKLEDMLAWHGATVAGLRPPRFEDCPECGWYKRRAVKGGPFLPCRVWLKQEIDPATGELTEPEVFLGECLGTRFDPYREWTYLRPISRDDYRALVDLHRGTPAMAATHAPMNMGDRIITPRSMT